jgi:hypothetical protein
MVPGAPWHDEVTFEAEHPAQPVDRGLGVAVTQAWGDR